MLDNLPLEILYIISEYIDIISLYKLTIVCSHINRLTLCKKLWLSKIKTWAKYSDNFITNCLYNHVSNLKFNIEICRVSEHGCMHSSTIELNSLDNILMAIVDKYNTLKFDRNFIKIVNEYELYASNNCINSNCNTYVKLYNYANVVTGVVNGYKSFAVVHKLYEGDRYGPFIKL